MVTIKVSHEDNPKTWWSNARRDVMTNYNNSCPPSCRKLIDGGVKELSVSAGDAASFESWAKRIPGWSGMRSPFTFCESPEPFAFEKSFPNDPPGEEGAFSGIHAAQEWLKANGYSYGRMQSHNPIGIVKGVGTDIMKWDHISPSERQELDGQIDPAQDFRTGGAVVRLKKSPEASDAADITAEHIPPSCH
jgi:hypothetical protein